MFGDIQTLWGAPSLAEQKHRKALEAMGAPQRPHTKGLVQRLVSTWHRRYYVDLDVETEEDEDVACQEENKFSQTSSTSTIVDPGCIFAENEKQFHMAPNKTEYSVRSPYIPGSDYLEEEERSTSTMSTGFCVSHEDRTIDVDLPTTPGSKKEGDLQRTSSADAYLSPIDLYGSAKKTLKKSSFQFSPLVENEYFTAQDQFNSPRVLRNIGNLLEAA